MRLRIIGNLWHTEGTEVNTNVYRKSESFDLPLTMAIDKPNPAQRN